MVDESHELCQAIEYFTNASSKTTSHKTNQPLYTALKKIEEVGKSMGLNIENLESLVDVVISGRFSVTVAIRLIKALIPVHVIPESIVIKIISALGANIKLLNSVKLVLWRWIVLIYDLIDSKSNLRNIYNIIFHYLQYETMCPFVAHLLYRLTRREHVQFFRIQRVVELQKRMINQPALKSLLYIYKLYEPQMVHIVAGKLNEAHFTRKDQAWAKIIKTVTSKYEQIDYHTNLLDTKHPDLQPLKSPELKPRTKRARHEVIPKYSTRVKVKDHRKADKTVPFEQLKTFNEFLQHLDKLELPNQIATVLRYPLLQRVVSCSPDRLIVLRLSYWLQHTLYDEFINSPTEGINPAADYLLDVLVRFTDYLQESIPVCDNFLTKYLYIWNGLDYKPHILKLISRFRICPFDELNLYILQPLKKLFFCSSIYFKCQLLKCFTELLQNFALTELPRYSIYMKMQQDASEYKHIFLYAFLEDLPEFQPRHTLNKLIEYVSNLCILGLIQEKHHSLFIHCMLSFFEVVASLEPLHQIHLLDIPPPILVYNIIFSSDATAISRLCQLIVSCGTSFESLKQSYLKYSLGSDVDLDLIKIRSFNHYVLDICDLFWRCKAFLNTNSSTKVLFIDEKLKPHLNIHNINETFSIQRHPAFLSFVYQFLIENYSKENQHFSVIKKDSRHVYLKYLKDHGITGCFNFIHKFIRQL